LRALLTERYLIRSTAADRMRRNAAGGAASG
jgi:hypothetical protein